MLCLYCHTNYRCAEYFYAECCIFVLNSERHMLNVEMLSLVMLTVIILSVVILSVIMLCVVASMGGSVR